ncbi:MAG: hypothetical protein GY845_25890 [Planctomycetes bacterium]|nr:hypothetical protein [Planctomycetota bacterium]
MKKKLLLPLIIVTLTIFLSLPGCDQIDAYTPEQSKAFAAYLETYDAKVNEGQVVAAESIKSLEEAGLVPVGTSAKYAACSDKIDKVQMSAKIIGDVIKNHKFQSESGLPAILETAIIANQASAPFNPYAAPIGAILLLLNGVTGIFAHKKTQEAKEKTKALTETIKGLEKFKNTTENGDAWKSVKAELTASHSSETKTLIAKLK